MDKYIGDALMALFGAPLEMSDQASQAIETALEMQTALRKLNQQLFTDGEYVLRFGMGFIPERWSQVTSVRPSAITTP